MSTTTRQSSPDFTPRTATLVRAAIDRIRDGETVVDLGAGRDAGVARAVRAASPGCRVVAVEPNVPIELPESCGIETVAGTLDDVALEPLDVVLFNSPNTPDRFVDRGDRSWHQFAGGPNGYECLHGVVAAALARIGPNGRVIFICPTFSPPPPAELSLLATHAEPLDPFLARSAVRSRLRPEHARFIRSAIERYSPEWAQLGVANPPSTATAAVLEATRARPASSEDPRRDPSIHRSDPVDHSPR